MNRNVLFQKLLMMFAAVAMLAPLNALAVDADDYIWMVTPSKTCESTPALVLREIRKGRCSIVQTQGHAAKVKCVLDGSASFMVLFDSRSSCDAVADKARGN